MITIDGTTGDVYGGEVPLVPASETPELEMLLAWADEFRTMGVRANADTPSDAARAREAGAEGIGLARTEHMFMGERLAIVQQIILNEDPEVRDPALERLRAQQTEDFEGLLEAMDGLPVIVRLLDPPLHEFLPSRLELERERRQRAEKGAGARRQARRVGTGGCQVGGDKPDARAAGVRLGLLVPELYRIQVQAALQAMRRRTEAGGDPRLEIMVPLVSTAEELRRVRTMIESEIAEVFPDETVDVPVGTMIELPRAALLAVRDRRRCRLLLVRNKRPHPNHLRVEPRRRRTVLSPLLPRAGHLPLEPVPDHGRARRGTAGGDGDRCREGGQPFARGRGVRRARRGSRLDRLVPPDRSRLRVGQPSPSRWPGWPRPRQPLAEGIRPARYEPGDPGPSRPRRPWGRAPALEPLGRSRTLPAEAYLSPDLFTWEIDHIFTGSWLCLGRVDGLVEAGQARALSAGRARLLPGP